MDERSIHGRARCPGCTANCFGRLGAPTSCGGRDVSSKPKSSDPPHLGRSGGHAACGLRCPVCLRERLRRRQRRRIAAGFHADAGAHRAPIRHACSGRDTAATGTGATGRWHGAVDRQRRERQSRQPARGAQRQRRWLRGLAGRRRHACATSGPTATAPRRPRGAARSTSRRAAPTSTTSISRSTPAATRWSHGTRIRACRLDFGVVMSARFDAGAGAWATPVLLNANVTCRASPAMPPAPCSPCTYVCMLQLSCCSRALLRPCQWHLAAGSCDRAKQPGSASARPGGIAGRQRQCARCLRKRAPSMTRGSGEQLLLTQQRGLGSRVWRSQAVWSRRVARQLHGGLDHRMELAASTDGDFLLAWQTPFSSTLERRGSTALRSASRNSRAAPGRGVRRRRWCRATPAAGRPAPAHAAAMPAATRSCCGPRTTACARRSRRSAWTMPAPPVSAVQVIDSAVGGGACAGRSRRRSAGQRHRDLAAVRGKPSRRGPSRGWLTQQHRDQPLRRRHRHLGQRGARRDATRQRDQSARKRQRRPGAARVDPGRGRRQPRQGAAATTDQHARSIAAPRRSSRAE